MQYTFRCILDVEEDVIRDISIHSKCNLEEFHEAITNAFGISLGEMAAFYKSDDAWAQGDEIPLFSMNEIGSSNEMKDFTLTTVFSKKGSKSLYVYDFLKMWTFFIELQKTGEITGEQNTKIVFSKGELPKQAPEKQFKSEKLLDDFESEFDDDYGNEFDDEFNEDFDSNEDSNDYF
ncbi:MAG TPA: hypothetical protein EYG92_09175 [Lutibacter sp.]|nr:hypothetical protein [Lutibacter sp.]